MPKTIGFRLDAASRRQMAERAAAFRMSPHDLARQYVVERLQQAHEPTELIQGLMAIHHELHESRIDLALALEVLLSQAGRLSETQARAWVKENYPLPCSPSPPP